MKRLLKLWIVDPKLTDGFKNRSASLTFTLLSFIFCWIKLFLSGVTLFGITFDKFSSEDFAIIFISTASLYFGQKSISALSGIRSKKDKSPEQENPDSQIRSPEDRPDPL